WSRLAAIVGGLPGAFKKRLIVFTFLTYHRKHVIHPHRLPFFGPQVQNGPLIVGFIIHCSLVGFDLGHEFTRLDLISNFLMPFRDNTFFHGIAHFGHPDDFCHWYSYYLIEPTISSANPVPDSVQVPSGQISTGCNP